MPETQDELKYAELMTQLEEIIPKLNSLLSAGKGTLRNQKYQMDNNHLVILDQHQQIDNNKAYLATVEDKAKAIIKVAEDRAKEVEKNLNLRSVETNSRERIAEEKMVEADKVMWKAQSLLEEAEKKMDEVKKTIPLAEKPADNGKVKEKVK